MNHCPTCKRLFGNHETWCKEFGNPVGYSGGYKPPRFSADGFLILDLRPDYLRLSRRDLHRMFPVLAVPME